MATTAAVITMSMREADRLKTIQAVVDRMRRVGQAAQRLELGRRQVERLVRTGSKSGRVNCRYLARSAHADLCISGYRSADHDVVLFCIA